MAPIMFCCPGKKWRTLIPTHLFINGINLLRQLQFHRTLVSENLPGRRNEENKGVEREELMDISKKHTSSAYMEILWDSLFSAPHKWYDFRTNKISQIAPDFKHIETGKGLWIKYYKTPDWVITKLRKLGKEAFAPSSTQNLWKALLANPSNWFDNRKIKKNNKHPDFVHKVTNEALWQLDYKTPAWVSPLLKNLQHEAFALTLSSENMWKNYFADPSKWLDIRKTKKNNKCPDFVHKDTHEALWINSMTIPTWVMPMLSNLEHESYTPCQVMENLWRTFFTNPSRWFDNRKSKKTIKHPDFIHRDTDTALWIDNIETPTWVIPKLVDLQYEVLSPLVSIENLWKAFFCSPSKWFDNRKTKKSNKHPDFAHRDTHEALWIDNPKNPAWVLPKLCGLSDVTFAHTPSPGKIWKNFFANPEGWFDNRKTKKRCTSPDFVHKHTGRVLWIENDSTPTWVPKMLIELPNCKAAPADMSESTWSALFINPSKWLDERPTKKNPRVADFKHKETGIGLWIDSMSTPAWVLSSLSNLENEAFSHLSTSDRQPEFLFVDPSFMFYIRKGKKEAAAAAEFTLNDD